MLELNQENSLLKRENEELTTLNKNLVDKIELLQGLIDGDASAKHFYMELNGLYKIPHHIDHYHQLKNHQNLH